MHKITYNAGYVSVKTFNSLKSITRILIVTCFLQESIRFILLPIVTSVTEVTGRVVFLDKNVLKALLYLYIQIY